MRFIALFVCVLAALGIGVAVGPEILKQDYSQPTVNREVDKFQVSKPYSLSNLSDEVSAWLMYDGNYNWRSMPGGALSELENQINTELEDKTDVRLSRLALDSEGAVSFCLLSYVEGEIVAFYDGTVTANGGVGSITRSARKPFTDEELERELSKSFCREA